MNNVVGTGISATYRAVGHKLLTEHSANAARSEDEKRYLLCVTKNRRVSNDLEIPAGVDCLTEPGNWFSDVFVQRSPVANLTEEEQKAAYLLALGYSPQQIASRMGKNKGAVDAHQRRICSKLSKANYDMGSGQPREKLREVIFGNLHEVRSVVVPLYPSL